MKIEYIKVGDYFIPNLTVKNVKGIENIGKYGRLRYKYLTRNGIDIMELEDIQKDVIETEIRAKQQLEIIMKQLIEKENITEDLKKTDNFEWARRMNTIKSIAEEIISDEIIYLERGDIND